MGSVDIFKDDSEWRSCLLVLSGSLQGRHRVRRWESRGRGWCVYRLYSDVSDLVGGRKVGKEGVEKHRHSLS